MSGLDNWFTVPVKYTSFSGQYHSNAPDNLECPINSRYDLKGENIRGNLNCIMPAPYLRGKKILFHSLSSSRSSTWKNYPLKKDFKKIMDSLAVDTIHPSCLKEVIA